MVGKNVPITPSSFQDDNGLLDLSLTEVVSLFIDKERSRSKDAREDENQQEDIVGCRTVPVGLLMALDGNARRLGITRAMLTKCVSHQIVVWLDNIDRIKMVESTFNVVCDAAEEFGYPDLYDDMTLTYAFANSASKQTTMRTIRWVKNKLHVLAQPLGVPAGSIFVIGLCYSLTRAGNMSKGTINKYLLAEVAKFVRHIDERSIKVCAFNDLVRRRAVEEGLENTKT